MFEPIRERVRSQDPALTPVSFEKWQALWAEWRKNRNLHWPERWGQFLCNKLNITEAQAPGLFYAGSVQEANTIFNRHFRLG
jgi:hypothetical protein